MNKLPDHRAVVRSILLYKFKQLILEKRRLLREKKDILEVNRQIVNNLESNFV